MYMHIIMNKTREIVVTVFMVLKECAHGSFIPQWGPMVIPSWLISTIHRFEYKNMNIAKQCISWKQPCKEAKSP